MASPARRLTDIAIRNLRPKATRYEFPDPGARGLYIAVFPSGRKSFCVRYRFVGQPRKLTLQAGISLAAARKLAADALHEVTQGRDPGETKKAQKAKAILARADTVQSVCENFLQREGKKLRTLRQQQRALARLVYPFLGDRLVSEVRRSEVNKMLDRIEDTSGQRSAELALQYLRRIFGWYAVQSDDFRSPIVKGMSRYKPNEHRRDRILNDREIQLLWQATEAGDAFSALIRFLLLTGARRAEAGGMTWAEISGNSWLLPAHRHKTKVDFLRPLSKAALAVLSDAPHVGDSPFVFSSSGRRPVHFGLGKQEFDKRCAIADWRLHDLRRSARTLLSRAGVSADTAERCLGHALPVIRGTYDKHSYFREMEVAFEALATQIHRIVSPPAGDVVTPLRKEVRVTS